MKKKNTWYQQTWSTTTPKWQNNPSYHVYVCTFKKNLIAQNLKIFGFVFIFYQLFFWIIFIEWRSKFIIWFHIICPQLPPDPIIGYRVSPNKLFLSVSALYGSWAAYAQLPAWVNLWLQCKKLIKNQNKQTREIARMNRNRKSENTSESWRNKAQEILIGCEWLLESKSDTSHSMKMS